ncbi:MAG: BspA family leucine-rich repeat surface protein [Prevotella sp.]|nr:BspA family leucine-rich repeat surface protein [Prevotella sp.]
MKRKILSLLVLLLMAVTGAWADDFYLVVKGTTATLMWDDKKGDNPYYTGSGWDSTDGTSASTAQSNVTTITVDGSCKNFTGTSLLYLFFQFTALTTVNGLENLNYKSSVTDMRAMFHSCSALTTLDLRNLNTASVTSMDFMFHTCTSLTSLDISGWNTEKVENMSGMFNNCTSLTAIYVGNNWNVNKVSDSKDMFYACSNLPNWDGTTDKTRANTGADGYLNKVKVTANLANGAYWSTFYSNVGNHLAPDGTQVFAVNLTGTTIEMTEIGDRIVKSDEGVVLKQVTESSEPTTTIIMTLTETTPTGDFTDNSLEGTMISIRNPGNAYVLNNGTAGIGFYKLSGSGTIDANKAYLTYDSKAGTRAFFGLDETTDVNEVRVKMEDERGEYYDLQGRRVAQPTKGLYIVNGKKVFIK